MALDRRRRRNTEGSASKSRGGAGKRAEATNPKKNRKGHVKKRRWEKPVRGMTFVHDSKAKRLFKGGRECPSREKRKGGEVDHQMRPPFKQKKPTMLLEKNPLKQKKEREAVAGGGGWKLKVGRRIKMNFSEGSHGQIKKKKGQ